MSENTKSNPAIIIRKSINQAMRQPGRFSGEETTVFIPAQDGSYVAQRGHFEAKFDPSKRTGDYEFKAKE